MVKKGEVTWRREDIAGAAVRISATYATDATTLTAVARFPWAMDLVLERAVLKQYGASATLYAYLYDPFGANLTGAVLAGLGAGVHEKTLYYPMTLPFQAYKYRMRTMGELWLAIYVSGASNDGIIDIHGRRPAGIPGVRLEAQQLAGGKVEVDSVGTMARWVIPWESDANGDAVVRLDGRDAPRLAGRPIQLGTLPSAGKPPTDNYDVTLEDEHGNDILQGAGANRDTANVETAGPLSSWAYKYLGMAWIHSGELWLRVANAGSGKAGTVIVYAELERVIADG